jgi:sodium transport system permease protein
VSPVRRTEVVVGKFLATLTFGLSAALMAIVGFLIGGAVLSAVFLPRLGDQGAEIVTMMGGGLNVSLLSIVVLIVSALLLAALVAAVLIGISLFARSFKEAQSYIAPLSFVFIIPVVLLQFKDLIGLGNEAYLIPVFNVLLLMDDVVRGVIDPSRLALVWGSMLVIILLLLAFAHRNFQREEVIFRS